jgi:hypothetical protein
MTQRGNHPATPKPLTVTADDVTALRSLIWDSYDHYHRGLAILDTLSQYLSLYADVDGAS